MATETPSRYTFTISGNRSFPIPTTIKGSNYCRIDIDGVEVVDTSLYDIINNTIVFLDTPSGTELDVYVVQSEEAIDSLGSISAIETVADNIDSINFLVGNWEELKEINLEVLTDPVFDTMQLSGGTGDQGKMTWNADEETLDLIQNGATLQLGQEVQTHCRNNSGSTITNGTVCMVTGTLGASGRVTIAPYDGTTDIKYVVGISTEDIADGTDGKVTCFGKVRGVDTSIYNEGDILYTTTGGGLTNVEPTSGIKNSIAFAVNSATNGTIMVRFTPIDEDQSIVNLKADKTNVLELDNTTSFIPTSDYHPSTKKYVDDEVTSLETSLSDLIIGVNQTWQNMSASRTSGVTYTNETGKPIQLWLQWGINDNGGSRTVTHNSLSFTYSSGDSWEASFQMIIPNGGTYSVDSSVDQWYELRE